MNVTRDNLLAATTTAITAYETKKASFDVAAKELRSRQNALAVSNALARQKTLRDALSKAIKAGKPLTSDEIDEAIPGRNSYVSSVGLSTRDSSDTPRSFELDGVRYERPGLVNLDDLKGLKSTLENVLEETISDGQLQRLGFRNMGWIFRAAVAN